MASRPALKGLVLSSVQQPQLVAMVILWSSLAIHPSAKLNPTIDWPQENLRRVQFLLWYISFYRCQTTKIRDFSMELMKRPKTSHTFCGGSDRYVSSGHRKLQGAKSFKNLTSRSPVESVGFSIYALGGFWMPMDACGLSSWLWGDDKTSPAIYFSILQ